MTPETGSVPRNSIWQAIWRAAQTSQDWIVWHQPVSGIVLDELRLGGWIVIDRNKSIRVQVIHHKPRV